MHKINPENLPEEGMALLQAYRIVRFQSNIFELEKGEGTLEIDFAEFSEKDRELMVAYRGYSEVVRGLIAMNSEEFFHAMKMVSSGEVMITFQVKLPGEDRSYRASSAFARFSPQRDKLMAITLYR